MEQIGKELGKGILRKVLFALSAGGFTLWYGVVQRRGGGSRAAVIGAL